MNISIKQLTEIFGIIFLQNWTALACHQWLNWLICTSTMDQKDGTERNFQFRIFNNSKREKRNSNLTWLDKIFILLIYIFDSTKNIVK